MATAAAAAAASTRTSKLKRRKPDRLGWLGGNSTIEEFQESPGESQDSSMLNPRPMEENFGGGGGTKVPLNRHSVDLTVDTDRSSNNDGVKTYECARCTLINPIAETNCQVCEARRCSIRKQSSGSSKRVLEDDIDSCQTDVVKRKHASTKLDVVPTQNVSKQQPKSSNAISRHLSTKSKESSQLWNLTHSQSSVKSKPSTSKKAKQSAKKSTHSSTISSQLWIDKHTPRTAAELCIAPKKIEEVRQWLRSHISARQTRRGNRNHQSNAFLSPYEASLEQVKLMILVGSPGIGKSTLIKVLAKELKLQLLTWNDAHLEYNYEQSLREEGVLPYQSQLASFEEFLVGAGVGLDSLGVDMHSSESGNGEYNGSVILIEDVSFYCLDLLCTLRLGLQLFHFRSTCSCKIPNLHNAEAAQSFR
jgi:cell cycle checkpoint protein